jgi:hypothetical protein
MSVGPGARPVLVVMMSRWPARRMNTAAGMPTTRLPDAAGWREWTTGAALTSAFGAAAARIFAGRTQAVPEDDEVRAPLDPRGLVLDAACTAPKPAVVISNAVIPATATRPVVTTSGLSTRRGLAERLCRRPIGWSEEPTLEPANCHSFAPARDVVASGRRRSTPGRSRGRSDERTTSASRMPPCHHPADDRRR